MVLEPTQSWEISFHAKGLKPCPTVTGMAIRAWAWCFDISTLANGSPLGKNAISSTVQAFLAGGCLNPTVSSQTWAGFNGILHAIRIFYGKTLFLVAA